MLKGKIELVSESSQQQELKFSKNVDEFEFFGMRQSATDTRGDHARAASESCWVIKINKEQYEQIVKKTQLSSSE